MPAIIIKRKSGTSSSNLRSDAQLIVKRLSRHGSELFEEDIKKMGADHQDDEETRTDDTPISRWRNYWIRCLWGSVMIFSLIATMSLGLGATMGAILVLQAGMFNEVIRVAHIRYKERKLAWFRTLNWYFLLCTHYFLFGENLIDIFSDSVFVNAFLLPIAAHHRFISFCLYLVGLIAFVLNLRPGHYKFQFNQFGVTHMTLLLVVVQAQFVINNMVAGMFWFVVPVVLVVWNDIMAYFCGFFFGRTPLIKLSPKKTWEGFLGALVFTIIFGFFISGWLAKYPYLTCPVKDFGQTVFSDLVCPANPLFEQRDYKLPVMLTGLLKLILGRRISHVKIFPVQLHVLAFSAFASLIAPFGGFFASGFKRAFKVKDFSDSIPGHGGVTDRMDCQFLMGSFVYLYYSSFLKIHPITVGAILQMAINKLSQADQRILYLKLQEYLINQELLHEPGPLA